jgi:hypothetical protein
MFSINLVWAVSASWSVAKPVIGEQAKHVYMYSDKSYRKEIGKLAELDQIPANYGGDGPEI